MNQKISISSLISNQSFDEVDNPLQTFEPISLIDIIDEPNNLYIFGNKHIPENKIPFPEEIRNIYNQLSAVYGQKLVIKRLFDYPSIEIQKHYVHLSLLEENEQVKKISQLENHVQKNSSIDYDEACEAYTKLYGEHNKCLTIENILEKCHGLAKKLLILGPAGIGKTTFSEYLTHLWSKNQFGKEYFLVFRIALRMLTKDRYPEKPMAYKATDFIKKECLERYEIKLTESETQFFNAELAGLINEGKILLIIDGYDEISEDIPDYIKLGIKELLACPHVILTSRPYNLYTLHQDYQFNPTLKLELTGFSPQNINDYVNKFFEHLEFPKPGSALDILLFLNANPNIKGMCRIPINLELVCSAWEKQPIQESKLSISKIYEKVMIALCMRYLEKKQIKTNNLTETALLKKCEQPLNLLEYFGFTSLLDGKLFMPLNKAINHLELDSISDELVAQQKLLAFVRPNNAFGKYDGISNYYFNHLTFRDYFAARYLCICIQTELRISKDYLISPTKHSWYHPKKISLEVFIKINKYNLQYEIFWWFVVGLLALKEDEDSLNYIFEIFLREPIDLTDSCIINLLIRCLDEANDIKFKLRSKIIDKLESYISLFLDRKTSSLFNLERNTFWEKFKLCDWLFQQESIQNIFCRAIENIDDMEDIAYIAKISANINKPCHYILKAIEKKILLLNNNLLANPFDKDFIANISTIKTDDIHQTLSNVLGHIYTITHGPKLSINYLQHKSISHQTINLLLNIAVSNSFNHDMHVHVMYGTLPQNDGLNHFLLESLIDSHQNSNLIDKYIDLIEPKNIESADFYGTPKLTLSEVINFKTENLFLNADKSLTKKLLSIVIDSIFKCDLNISISLKKISFVCKSIRLKSPKYEQNTLYEKLFRFLIDKIIKDIINQENIYIYLSNIKYLFSHIPNVMIKKGIIEIFFKSIEKKISIIDKPNKLIRSYIEILQIIIVKNYSLNFKKDFLEPVFGFLFNYEKTYPEDIFSISLLNIYVNRYSHMSIAYKFDTHDLDKNLNLSLLDKDFELFHKILIHYQDLVIRNIFNIKKTLNSIRGLLINIESLSHLFSSCNWRSALISTVNFILKSLLELLSNQNLILEEKISIIEALAQSMNKEIYNEFTDELSKYIDLFDLDNVDKDKKISIISCEFKYFLSFLSINEISLPNRILQKTLNNITVIANEFLNDSYFSNFEIISDSLFSGFLIVEKLFLKYKFYDLNDIFVLSHIDKTLKKFFSFFNVMTKNSKISILNLAILIVNSNSPLHVLESVCRIAIDFIISILQNPKDKLSLRYVLKKLTIGDSYNYIYSFIINASNQDPSVKLDSALANKLKELCLPLLMHESFDIRKSAYEFLHNDSRFRKQIFYYELTKIRSKTSSTLQLSYVVDSSLKQQYTLDELIEAINSKVEIQINNVFELYKNSSSNEIVLYFINSIDKRVKSVLVKLLYLQHLYKAKAIYFIENSLFIYDKKSYIFFEIDSEHKNEFTAFFQQAKEDIADGIKSINLFYSINDEDTLMQQKDKHEERMKDEKIVIDEAMINYSTTSDIESVFLTLLQKGLVWKDFIKHFVTQPLQLLNQNEISHNELSQKRKVMQALINFRDTLDHRHYRYAIEALFKDTHFTVDIDPAASFEEKTVGRLEIKVKWYHFNIYNQPSQGANLNRNAPHCTITIKAPGSRTLTSDVDTTVSVEGAEYLSKTYLAKIYPKQGKDYNNLIKNSLVSYFYKESQDKLHVTSGENRDSNVYADGFMADYPKFVYSSVNDNPIINGKPLLSNAEFKPFYAPFKQLKHLWEMSASLHLLRKHFADDAQQWIAFKEQVFEAFISCQESIEITDDLLRTLKEDFEVVWLKTDDLYQQAERELSAEIKRLMEDKYAQESPLKEHKDKWLADITVHAMNNLYINKLQAIINSNDEIEAYNNVKVPEIIQSINTCMNEMNRLQNELKELKAVSTPSQTILNIINRTQLEAVKQEETYKKYCFDIHDLLRARAELIIRKQQEQLQAILFANEAYTNRSAPYHVVVGMQQGNKDQPISKQTFIGSALQQIGFRLSHAKKQREEGFTEGEIAYRNAKYGMRVADLVYGSPQAYKIEDIKNRNKIGAKSTVKILTCLHSNILTKSKLLTDQELYLLSSETEIASLKKTTLAEDEKAAKAHDLLRQRAETILNKKSITEEELNGFLQKNQGDKDNEKMLLTSIGAKLVAVGYFAKIEKTQTTLWGPAEETRKFKSNNKLAGQKRSADVPEQPQPNKKPNNNKL